METAIHMTDIIEKPFSVHHQSGEAGAMKLKGTFKSDNRPTRGQN